jgi:aryl-alcohol dehydrogenase-like predicted oxidoreductase
MQEINKTEVKQRILRACERLQVDRLPLVAFFWADYSVKRYTTVALWLSELKEEGLIQESWRSFGFSPGTAFGLGSPTRPERHD